MKDSRQTIIDRIQAALAKYGLAISEVSDTFGKRGREILAGRMAALPPHTRHTTGALLAQLDSLEGQIKILEERVEEVFAATPEIELLRSIPGVGALLSIVIACEVGRIGRFPRAEQLAPYAGYHAQGTLQRRKDPLWAPAARRQPLPQICLYGSSQLDRAERQTETRAAM